MTTRPTILQSAKVVGEQVYADDGDATDPGFVFSSDSDTGMYREGTPSIRWTIAGAYKMGLSASGLYPALGSFTGTNVIATSGGLLARDSSSKRYKKNIVETALDSNKVYDLEPVDFEWNENALQEGEKSFGLIAEEVEKLFPEIVHYNEDGTVESVAYDRLSLLLLMEIKKLKLEIEKLKENT